MTELALGPFGDNAHHGDVQNPWRIGHVSGGSSSGSGAAVAAGLAAGALGTDTGGSIRLPAAACGVVGLKPTYGRVSRAGVMPLSWSYDHVGPLARTVRDAALMLATIAGVDPLDATTSRQPVPDYVAALDGSVAGLRIGVAGGFYADGLDATVTAALAEAVTALGGLGARVEPLAVPDPGPIVSGCSNVMVRAESAAIHSRLLKERPGELQPAVRDRMAPGLTVTAYDYLQGQRLRALLTREFIDARVLARRRAGHPDHPRAGPRAGPRQGGRHRRRHRAHGPLLAAHPAVQRPRSPGAVAALRRRAPTAARSRCSSWAGPSTRPPSCASATPTSARPRGIVAAPALP